jgi:hypothetical protein
MIYDQGGDGSCALFPPGGVTFGKDGFSGDVLVVFG